MTELTTYQVSLQHHEQIIDTGVRHFVEAGNSLAVIREERLYRDEYKTFDEYCDQRWGWTRQRVSQLIAAAEVFENLSTAGLQTLPSSEKQIRSLAKLEPAQQVEVWSEAVETAEQNRGEPHVTSRHVEEVVRKHTEPVESDEFAQEFYDTQYEQPAPIEVEHNPAPKQVSNEPNLIGQARERIADTVDSIISNQPPYFVIVVAEYLEELASEIRSSA